MNAHENATSIMQGGEGYVLLDIVISFIIGYINHAKAHDDGEPMAVGYTK